MLRVDRVARGAHKLGPHSVEVDLVTEPAAERVERPRGGVA